MNFSLKILSSFFLLVCFTYSIQAAHIVGGQMTYECIDPDPTDNTVIFEIRTTIFRDLFSGGAEPDPDADFGIYKETSPGNWEFVDDLPDRNFQDRTEIGFDDSNPCVDIPENVGTERYSYVFTVALEVTDCNYMIAYQRCCRNSTINNIQNPGDTGAAFFIEITPEAQVSCDNSPVFDEFPPIFICQNQALQVDHSASDAEGDVLVYSFCPPKSAGGTDGTNMGGGNALSCTGVTPDPANCTPPFDDVVYLDPVGTVGGFSWAEPLAGNPTVSINPTTGIITGVPEQLGQYVVGVCVQAFRNGVLVSEIVRDFQFNVVACDPVVIANLAGAEITGPKQFYYKLCGENELDIQNLSIQLDKIETYEWAIDINGITDTMTTADASYVFPTIGQYTGTMVLNGGFECTDTAFITIDVFPGTDVDFEFVYDTCVPGPVNFMNTSMTSSAGIVLYNWDFGEPGLDTFSTMMNPEFEYPTPGDKEVTLTVTDVNNCEFSKTTNLPYFPVAETLISAPSSFIGCVPATIQFDNLSDPINEEYTTNWTFGDGNSSTELSPAHLYEVEGTYTVTLEVISPIGCMNDRTFNGLIQVRPSPIADFECTPEEFNTIDNQIFLSDRSTFAERLSWIIPGVGTSDELNPTFTFPDTGLYEINLVAIHASGCPDTMTKIIDVAPLNAIYFPNAFTPNNDGKNDDFKPVGLVEGFVDYELNVWNRWGELIFKTDNLFDGWDGTKNNQGTNSPEGTYIYTYNYLSGRGDQVEGQGKIILLR